MSRLSVQIMGTENTSYAEQKSFNNAVNVARTQNLAATEATESGLQSSTNFLSRLGTDQFKGEDYTKNTSASEAKSLQNFNNFVKTLQENKDFTETQAVEAALGASVGGGLKFLSADAKGSFSSAAARQKAIQDATSLAKQTGYSESAEKVVAAAQSLSQGMRDSKGAELGESAAASLNQAKGLREEASIAQNKVDTISRDRSSSQSKALTVQKELTQAVFEFIAHQPSNPGPNGLSGGKIGHKEALRILNENGEESAIYRKCFQEKNPQYSIQAINVAGAQKALSMHYESEAQQYKNNTDVSAQNASNIQDVEQRSKEAGLDRTKANLDQTQFDQTSIHQKKAESPQKAEKSDPSAKEFFSQQLQDIENKIEVGQKPITDQEQVLQKAERDSQTKTLGGTAMKNLVKSGGKGLLSTANDIHEAIKKLPPEPPIILP